MGESCWGGVLGQSFLECPSSLLLLLLRLSIVSIRISSDHLVLDFFLVALGDAAGNFGAVSFVDEAGVESLCVAGNSGAIAFVDVAGAGSLDDAGDLGVVILVDALGAGSLGAAAFVDVVGANAGGLGAFVFVFLSGSAEMGALDDIGAGSCGSFRGRDKLPFFCIISVEPS